MKPEKTNEYKLLVQWGVEKGLLSFRRMTKEEEVFVRQKLALRRERPISPPSVSSSPVEVKASPGPEHH